MYMCLGSRNSTSDLSCSGRAYRSCRHRLKLLHCRCKYIRCLSLSTAGPVVRVSALFKTVDAAKLSLAIPSRKRCRIAAVAGRCRIPNRCQDLHCYLGHISTSRTPVSRNVTSGANRTVHAVLDLGSQSLVSGQYRRENDPRWGR